MTGRELILYILSNGLEDEPVFKDGKLIGFMTVGEAAEKFGVGVATILVYMNENLVDGLVMGDTIYIPANFNVSGLSN